ncbi:MAG: hypothetical protein AB7P00_12070 [Sandaracinaceae bacterium]
MRVVMNATTIVRWTSVLVLVGCDAQGAQLAFEGQRDFLPGFDYSTGYIPASSPVQIEANASASGGVTVRAAASSDGSALTPTPASGELTTEGSISIEILANIDFSGITYNGPVETFEYAVGPSTAMFEPFSIGAAVPLDTPLPAQDLGTVPIPSVPGATLTLSVSGGSLSTTFQGVCAEARDGVGQYTGTVTTSGTIQMAATVNLSIPIVGDMEFGPFEFEVPIPESATPMDLGSLSLSTGTTVMGPGPCEVGPGLDGGAMRDGGVGPADGGTGDGSTSPDGGGTCSLCGGCTGTCTHDDALACDVCVHAASPILGAPCVDTENCGGSLVCLNGECTSWCADDTGCTADAQYAHCAYFDPDPIYPGLCWTGRCDPVDLGACPSGQVCSVIGQSVDGTIATDCFDAASTLSPGSVCDGSISCAAGHWCYLDTCTRLCRDDTDCGTGGTCNFDVLGTDETGASISTCL